MQTYHHEKIDLIEIAMKTRFSQLQLCLTIIYFSCFVPSVYSFQSSTGNGIHLCGYGDGQADNRRYARNLAFFNVGTPRTVRLIYFLPADRQPRQGIEEKIDTLIKDVRQFYADQMGDHGFGRRTFNIETGHDGRARVHRVNGQFADTYYHGNYQETLEKIWREIHSQFDTSQNIYLALVDVGNEQIGDVAGVGLPIQDWGGLAAIPASGNFFNAPLAAHELGHTFGLEHDFRSTDHVMSYGPWNWGRTTKLSECTAKWLEIHRYFNPDIQLRPWNFPTIERISPRRYIPGSASVPIQLRVNDFEGLHQVLLLGSRDNVSECRDISGEQSSLVKFDYDGIFTVNGFASLTNQAVHPIRARLIDTDGNVSETSFNLFPETLQSLTKISGDNQPPGLPNAPLPVPLAVELRNLNDGSPYEGVWVSFTVTAGGGSLSETGALTNVHGGARTVFTLGPYLGTNTVEVSALGYTATFNAMAGSPVNLPDPLLRAAVAKTLDKVSGEPISQAEMATLTYTARGSWSLGISDLTGLQYAVNFTYLDLDDNSLTDISALSELTRLIQLALGNNSIVNISPLAGLSNLEWLVLDSNSVSDISTLAELTELADLSLDSNSIANISSLAELTALRQLVLGNNDISDISPLTGLMNLKAVQLSGNSISDLSPLAENQGIGDGTEIDVRENPLSYPSIQVYIPALQERGVEIDFDNRTPATLEPISGDGQEGLPGKALADPFIVEAKDESGLGFEGVPVTFAVSAGGGTLANRTTTTDSNGRATNILTLGEKPGTNTVRVSVKEISELVTFNADGIRVPGALSIISGNNQEGFPGETLPNPLKVVVKDQFEKPLRNVQVTFDVTAGGGKLTYPTVKTSRDGRAESELTLGPNAGINTVSVSASGIERLQSFNAEGVRRPALILKISGEHQEGLPGAALTDAFVVEIQDKTGSPLEGILVRFVVTAGDGSLNAKSMETASNGRAESTLTLGLSPGTHSVEASAEGIDATIIFSIDVKRREFILPVPSRTSLIHLPLNVTATDNVEVTIESVGDLYDALGGAEAVNFLTTRDTQTHQWQSYLGDINRGTNADPLLTIDKGIMASMKAPVNLHLIGEALGADGSSTIRLQPGTNLVGVPLRDSRIVRVSDLFALEGIRDNVTEITVSVNRGFKVVKRAGDDGDVPIVGGQSFIMDAQYGAAVAISGNGWGDIQGVVAAPPLVITGTNVQDFTPVLCVTGSIGYGAEEREGDAFLTKSGLSVIVENLMTGRVYETFAPSEDALRFNGLSYQLTAVETAAGLAAQVGDIIEVSIQSGNPLIRVNPLLHTVTPIDVKNNRIELSELIVYEIPAETILLMNYPNPFNPETWMPYLLAEEGIVTLRIYDARGELVRRLDMGHQSAGYYTDRGRAAYWDGRNESGESVASGLYFYHLGTPSFRQFRRMLIVK